MSDDKKDGGPDKVRHATASVTGVEARGEVGEVLVEINAVLRAAAWLRRQPEPKLAAIVGGRNPAVEGYTGTLPPDLVEYMAGWELQQRDKRRDRWWKLATVILGASVAGLLAIIAAIV